MGNWNEITSPAVQKAINTSAEPNPLHAAFTLDVGYWPTYVYMTKPKLGKQHHSMESCRIGFYQCSEMTSDYYT